MERYQDLEDRIRKTAADIYSSAEGEVPSLFDTKRWLGKLMEWAMSIANKTPYALTEVYSREALQI